MFWVLLLLLFPLLPLYFSSSPIPLPLPILFPLEPPASSSFFFCFFIRKRKQPNDRCWCSEFTFDQRPPHIYPASGAALSLGKQRLDHLVDNNSLDLTSGPHIPEIRFFPSSSPFLPLPKREERKKRTSATRVNIETQQIYKNPSVFW
jgi:hypothetical protein